MAEIEEFLSLSKKERTLKVCNFKINVETCSKEERGIIHKKISKCLPGFVSETIDEDCKRYIICKYSPKHISHRQKGRHLSFILRKRNWDTMRALHKISKALHRKPGCFFFAGTKDKRAETVQRIVAQEVSKEELSALILSQAWNREEIRVCALEYTPDLITIGNLQGNRFTLALRLIKNMVLEPITKNCQNISSFGFINFFGLQRFGTKESSHTHETGKLLLLKDYRGAFESILRADSADIVKNDIINQFFLDGDVEKALKGLSFKYAIERDLLLGIKKAGPNNYLEAINSLAKTLRNLYIHAYQSFLWNTVVSKRIEIYGHKLVLGDYVLDDNTHFLIETEEQLNRYSMEDTSIPILGQDTCIDNKSIAYQLYATVMRKENLCRENFQKHPPSFSISGNWRKTIVKPANFRWTLCYFDDWNTDILSLDAAEDEFYLKGKSEGTQTAIIAQFSLPKASYATMLIRELLHKKEDSLSPKFKLETKDEHSLEPKNTPVVDKS